MLLCSALLNQRWVIFWFTGILSSSLLAPTALADEDRAPPSGRSSGGRGCGLTAAPHTSTVPALILLTPDRLRGQMTPTAPMFAWFVRDPEVRPLGFRLYELDNGKFRLLKATHTNSTFGIMVLPFSAAELAMSVGKRYRWQVELICNPNRPSGNVFAEAEIEVVALQPALRMQLEQDRDRAHQALLYAQHGLWYDALRTVLLPALLTDSADTNLTQLRQSLLARVAANDTEQKLLEASPVRWVTPDSATRAPQ